MSKNDLSAPVSPLPFCPKTQKMQFVLTQIAFLYPKPYQISISLQDASYIPAFPPPRRIRRPLRAASATRQLSLKVGWGENFLSHRKNRFLHSCIPPPHRIRRPLWAADAAKRLSFERGSGGKLFFLQKEKISPRKTPRPTTDSPRTSRRASCILGIRRRKRRGGRPLRR